jgi:hypothetical protein
VAGHIIQTSHVVRDKDGCASCFDSRESQTSAESKKQRLRQKHSNVHWISWQDRKLVLLTPTSETESVSDMSEQRFLTT